MDERGHDGELNWSDDVSGLDSTACQSTSQTSGEGTFKLSASCQDLAGNKAKATYTVKVDETSPVTNVTLAQGSGTGSPLVYITAKATITGAGTGGKGGTGGGPTISNVPVNCWDTRGVHLILTATDTGSGVATLTYAAAGRQQIGSTTVSTSSADVAVSAEGVSTVTFAATDKVANQEANKSETVIVGNGYACSTPGALTLPSSGTVQLQGKQTDSQGNVSPAKEIFTY